MARRFCFPLVAAAVSNEPVLHDGQFQFIVAAVTEFSRNHRLVKLRLVLFGNELLLLLCYVCIIWFRVWSPQLNDDDFGCSYGTSNVFDVFYGIN